MGIAAAEQNIIDRVKAVLVNRVRTVESLPGDWDEDTMKRVLRLTPGVFVVWAGGGAKVVGGVAASIQGLFAVYVVTAHASGEAARRRGDSQQAGAYELIETLVPALHGHKVPDMGSLSLVRVENLYNGAMDKQGVAIYGITFELPMTMPATVDEDLLAPFETFNAKWDVPPHVSDAEHRQWLQNPPNYDDTRPDAEDSVGVPQ